MQIRHRVFKDSDLTYRVDSAEMLLSEKARADGFRATSAHARNAVSSRSHALFTMEVQIQRQRRGPFTKWSNVHVCDLAGFENINQTNAVRGQDLHAEGLAITQSLEALKNTLKDRKGGLKVSANARTASKLIYLLLDCLGGQASMTVVVNVSPLGGEHLVDTIKTLEFAMLAKAVRQTPTSSWPQLNSNAMKNIIRQTNDLEAELERAKERLKRGEGDILEINRLKNDLAVATKYLEDSLRAKDDAEVSKLKQVKMNEVRHGSISKLSTIHDVLMNFANEETFCEVGQPRSIVLKLQEKMSDVKTCEENMQKALQTHVSLCYHAKALTDSLDTAVNDFLASKLKVESLRHLVHIKMNSWKVSETIQKANEALTLFNTNAQKVTKHLRSIHFSCLDVLLSADLPAACHKLECAAAIFSPCVPDDWDQDERVLDSISDSKLNVDVVDINVDVVDINDAANSTDDNQNVRFISMTSSIEVLFDSVYPGDVFHEDALDDSPADAPVIIKWTSAVLHHARRVLQSWLERTPMGDAEVWEKVHQGRFNSLQNPPRAPDVHFVDFFKVCHRNYSDVMIRIGERLLVQIGAGCSDWRATVKLAEEVSEAILSMNLDALETFSTNGVDSFNALLLHHSSSEMDVCVEHLKPDGADSDCIKLDDTIQEIMNTICVEWTKKKRLEQQYLQQAKDEEMESLRENHEAECGDLKYQKDVEMESLRETHEAADAQLQQEHRAFRDEKEVEMVLFRETHEAQRAHLQTQHEDQLVAKVEQLNALQQVKIELDARVQYLDARQLEESERLNEVTQDLSYSADQLKAQVESMEETLSSEKQKTQAVAAANVVHVEGLIHRIDNTFSKPEMEEGSCANSVDPSLALGKLLKLLDVYIQGALPPPIAGSGLDVIRARQQAKPQSIGLEKKVNSQSADSMSDSVSDSDSDACSESSKSTAGERERERFYYKNDDQTDLAAQIQKLEMEKQAMSAELHTLQVEKNAQEQSMGDKHNQEQALREELEALREAKSAQKQLLSDKNARELAFRMKLEEMQMAKVAHAQSPSETGEHAFSDSDSEQACSDSGSEQAVSDRDTQEQALRAELKALLVEKPILERSLSDKDTQEQALRAGLDALVVDNTSQSQEQSLPDRDAQEQALRVELDSLRSGLEASSAQIVQLNSQSQHMSEVEEKLKAQIASLRTELEMERKTTGDINTREQALRVELEEMQMTKLEFEEKLKAQIASLRTELEMERKTTGDINTREQALRVEVEDMLAKIEVEEKLNAEIASLRTELEMERKTTGDINTREQALRVELEEMQMTNIEVEERLKAEIVTSRLKAQIKSLREKLHKAEESKPCCVVS